MRSLQIRIEDLQRALVKFTITALSKQPPHQMFVVVVLLRRWSAHHRLFEAHTDIRAQTAEIQKIGVNVNQIAKRVNSTGSVYQEDIEEIKGVLAEIWRLQRLSLLRER